jgi:WD40 repeat protein
VTAEAQAPAVVADKAGAFISYAREDDAFARMLCDALTAQGRDVWADWDGIPLGATWDAEIARGIEEADAFLFILSPDSVASVECGRELTRAVEQAKRLFPLLYRAVEPGDAPAALRPVQWTDFRDEGRFDAAFTSLTNGLDTDLQWVRAHTRLLVRTHEWEAGGRDRAFLLRGRDLAASEQWLAEQTPARQPTELQARYVHASRLAATARQRVTIGAIVVALAVAVGLSILPVIKSRQAVNEAKVARARELATAAVSQFSTDPELGVLLATEAARIRPSLPQVTDVLREALFRSPIRRVLHAGVGEVYHPRFSPDGRLLLATVNTGAHAFVWSVAAGKLVARPGAPGRSVLDAAFSADGTRVITAESDGSARIWDTATWRAVGLLHGGVLGVGRTPFSATGTEALTFGRGETTSVWNVATGTRIALLRSSPRGDSSTTVVAAAFTPDGRRVLVVTSDALIREWNPATERVVSTWRGPTDRLDDAQFTRDRERVVLARADTARAWLWRFRRGRPDVMRTGRSYSSAWFSGDLTLSAESTGSGVRVVRLTSSETIADFPVSRLDEVTFSPSNRQVATAGLDEVRIWNVGGQDLLATLRIGTAGVVRALFDPSGKRVLALGGGTARVWRPALRQPANEPRAAGRGIAAAVFSPDGKSIVTAGQDGGRTYSMRAPAHCARSFPGRLRSLR